MVRVPSRHYNYAVKIRTRSAPVRCFSCMDICFPMHPITTVIDCPRHGRCSFCWTFEFGETVGKLFLTSINITGPALQYTKWGPRWHRRLALCLHLYCLSRSPILLHPMPLSPLLYRLRGPGRPTCCPLKKSSSLVSQRRRPPRKCPRAAGTGPRPVFMHRLPLLRPKLTGPSRTNPPNDYPQSLSPVSPT